MKTKNTIAVQYPTAAANKKPSLLNTTLRIVKEPSLLPENIGD